MPIADLAGSANFTAQPWGPSSGSGVNPQGAGADPFAYTQGSLLTPWQGKFQWSGGSGNYKPPTLPQFQFGQAPNVNVGRVNAMQLDPRADFSFKFDPNEDPGAQYRLQRSQQALENSAAARGNYFTPNVMQSLQENAQGLAAQEYQSAFDRALNTYGTNLNKDFGTFDRNWGAQRDAGQININAALGEGQLNQGAWDRNYMLARTQWQDAADAAKARAAASASNAQRARANALQEYQMGRDEYWTNQDRQYNMLMGAAGMGYGAAARMGDYGSQYGANAANLYTGAGNARAAGAVGSGNAWSGALGNMGNAAMSYGMWNATGGGGWGNGPGYHTW